MKTVAHLIMNLRHFQMSGRAAEPPPRPANQRSCEERGLGESSSITVHTSDETTQDTR